jgi:hypothetical protein
MNIVGSVAGGSGNMFVFLLQRKYRFATKKGVCYGAFMTLLPYVAPGPIAGDADLVVICGVPLELVPILSVSIKVSRLILQLCIQLMSRMGILGRSSLERKSFISHRVRKADSYSSKWLPGRLTKSPSWPRSSPLPKLTSSSLSSTPSERPLDLLVLSSPPPSPLPPEAIPTCLSSFCSAWVLSVSSSCSL